MNLEDIPYNMDFAFDELLRELPDDANEMAEGIAHLKTQSVKLLGLIGVYSRMVGRLEDAEYYLNQALDACKRENNVRGVLTNKIRLAHVYQWKGEFQRADQLYADVLTHIQSDETCDRLLDFTYQHMAKSKFDQREYEHALGLFNKALEIRLEKGNAELIASTEHAISMTQKMMK